MVLGFRPLHYHFHLVCLTKASFCDCFQAITGVSVYMKSLLFFLLLFFFFCPFFSSFSFFFFFPFLFPFWSLFWWGVVCVLFCCWVFGCLLLLFWFSFSPPPMFSYTNLSRPQNRPAAGYYKRNYLLVTASEQPAAGHHDHHKLSVPQNDRRQVIAIILRRQDLRMTGRRFLPIYGPNPSYRPAAG